MVQMNFIYEGDLHCEVTHTPSGTKLSTDAPVDNQGKGASFSPTDLVATALGTCILTVMGIAARNMGIDMKGATASVKKEMIATPARRIGKLTTVIHMPCRIDAESQKKLETAAHTCPVKQSLHPDLQCEVTFHWPE